MELIDRERELRQLADLPDPHRPRLGIVYGRRQVGKTFLLARAWPHSRSFYFLAADSTPDLNRQDLLRELGGWSGQQFEPADYPTWRTVFRLFVELATQHPLVVVLDEFQYLLGGEDDAASQLVAVWDREAQGKPLTLILCGSAVSTMERLQAGGQPLFGRANWSTRLLPFDYRDAARMAPDRSHRDATLIYGIFGGTPRYLAAIRPREAVSSAASRTMLSPEGEVNLQLSTLLEQEHGIRDPAVLRGVLIVVASGRTTINDIAQGAGLGDQPHVARRALDVLESLELVGRWRNFGAGPRAPFRHYVSDNAILFWHRFVLPHRSRLVRADERAIWRELVAPFLNDYMGPVFERVVEQAFVRYHERWRLPAPDLWASWTGQDRNRRSIEIDVVARLSDGRMLTGEVKWSSERRGFELHNALTRDLEDLANSGQRWAHDAMAGERLYVAAGGFTDEFSAWASKEKRVHLLELHDLYPD